MRYLPNPDHLKPLENICSPDPRSGNFAHEFASCDVSNAIAEHHAEVSKLKLITAIPETVRIQFEAAKNLYLYAWFVYRFYPIAEHHALTCLELGLRQRFPEPLPKKYWNNPKREPTLSPLLRFAVDNGVIKNEGFRRWHTQVQARAVERYSHECVQDMIERNLNQIELNYEQVTPNDQDREWDLLLMLLEVLPGLRNAYAHGSSMLHHQVLGTLELVSEILGQLFVIKDTGTGIEIAAAS